MFDISWSEFLILAVVTLLVVGPKDLPRLMRVLGQYAGVVKRQAAEFRQQFDEAMREAELADIKKEVDRMQEEIAEQVRTADRAAADASRKSDAPEAASKAVDAEAPPAPIAFPFSAPKPAEPARSETAIPDPGPAPAETAKPGAREEHERIAQAASSLDQPIDAPPPKSGGAA